MRLGLREELEALREGGPVTDAELRRVADAALRHVPADRLLAELARRGGWAEHPSGELRLVLMTEHEFATAHGFTEDLTPPHSWRLL